MSVLTKNPTRYQSPEDRLLISIDHGIPKIYKQCKIVAFATDTNIETFHMLMK